MVDQRAMGASTRSTVGTAIDAAPLVRLLFSRIGQPSAGGSMAYSFNHPLGMCPDCTGIGEQLVLVEDRMFDMSKTLAEGALRFSQFTADWQTYLYQNNPLLDPHKKLCDFMPDEIEILKHGAKDKVQVEIRSNNTGRVDKVDYEGVIVEHRLELIAQADYIIDTGPERGSDGGEVMFSGAPEELLKCERSKTAEYMRKSI